MYRTPLLDDGDKSAFYSALAQELLDLVEYEDEWLPGLGNAAALLGHQLRDINWAGFYLVKNGLLILGPFQGKPACSAIVFGNGVCGSVAQEGKALVVPDVHEFPGHIACDEASQSEIVVPVMVGDRVVAVLDIDSPIPDRFSAEDVLGLEAFAGILAKYIDWSVVRF
jgi:GAF domain-containing protein